jgi:hypothetical protein
LIDPNQSSVRLLIARSEHLHVTNTLRHERIDAHASEHFEVVSGRRRFGLEFKKTRASYEKARKKFELNCRLLRTIRNAVESHSLTIARFRH